MIDIKIMIYLLNTFIFCKERDFLTKCFHPNPYRYN